MNEINLSNFFIGTKIKKVRHLRDYLIPLQLQVTFYLRMKCENDDWWIKLKGTALGDMGRPLKNGRIKEFSVRIVKFSKDLAFDNTMKTTRLCSTLLFKIAMQMLDVNGVWEVVESKKTEVP